MNNEFIKTINFILSIGLLICFVAWSCRPDTNSPRDSKGRTYDNSKTEVCRHGVVYYYDGVDFGYSPKFLPNSKVETCK